MISADEDALICDLAETYQIYDYKQLPMSLVAVFSCGLKEDSRIKMKLGNQKAPLDILLLAGISDTLSLLWWTKTKDGEKGKNKPPSIVASFSETQEKEKAEVVFKTGEDFERMRSNLLGGSE